MKNIIYLLAFVLIVSCKSKTEKTEENTWVEDPNAVETTLESSDSHLNKMVPDPDEEYAGILLGKIDRKGLEQDHFKTWFNESYEAHPVDSTTISKIEPYLEAATIKVFMGTWCEDSQREVPALYRILDLLNFEDKNLEVIAVSREKDTPQGYEKELNIEYVPTIIIYKNGEEMGRFVEYAQETLEKDMLAIVTGADYKHAYAE